MRTILPFLISLLVVTAIPSCKTAGPAVTAAGTCEWGVVTQVVKEDGVSILVDITKAVLTGADAVPALIARLITDFDAPTVACASQFVDAIESVQVVPAGSGATVVAPSPGLTALKAEMAKRGWTK